MKISTVDWCEPNYDITRVLAEFWNVLSSLWISFLGIYGLYIHRKVPCKLTFSFPYLFIGMIIVSIGSALFHGTLTWITQVMDEIPMLLFVSQAIVSLDEKRAWLWYSLYLSTSFLYIYTRFYPIFLIKFIGGICHVVYLYHITKSDIKPRRVSVWVNKLIYIFATCYSVGLAFWILENILCEKYGHFYMHSFWHIISGLGTYNGVVALMIININNKNQHFKMSWFFLPHIIICKKSIV